MSPCPCGSANEYDHCCGPLITAEREADTAEALMRSRYTAYTRTETEYLLRTIHPAKQDTYDAESIRKWSEEADWQGLEIMATDKGGREDDTGTVEFTARYTESKEPCEHHEIADFKKLDGKWYFFDGRTPRPETFVRQEPKIGRNAPCPCQSGKKYKKCCGR